MEIVWSIARIAVTVYAGCCLLVLFRQSHYVYYPDRHVDMLPSQLGMDFEDVVLETADGESIAAWHVPAATNAAGALTILFAHGNAGDIGDRVGSVRTFHDLGFNVLIFDYRGYGTSSGKPTEQGTYLDAKAAWDYLLRQRSIPADRIVVFGRSLGAAIAAALAEDVHPAALVLESPFTSARDMAARMFPLLPLRWAVRFKYDTLSRVKRVACPILVAHSRNDELIPFSQGKRVFDAANDPKIFVELSGGHNAGGLDISPDYQKTLVEFLAQRSILK